MNSTVRMSANDIEKDWHVVDAAGRPLGRVASEVARLIVGKHKPTFEPHLDDGDYVVVLNASKVRLTGRKTEQMVYYRHSGYPGGLKSRSFDQQMERFPETILERAINGMLPKGFLGQKMRRHVKIYRGAEHPHHGQIAETEKRIAERDGVVAAALDQAISSPKPPPRLRPLAVPQVTDAEEAPVEVEVEAVVVAEPEPEVEEKPKPKRRRTTKKAAEAPAAEEAATEDAPAAAADEAEATVEEKPKPKRRTRRKKAETTEEAPAAEAESATETEE